MLRGLQQGRSAVKFPAKQLATFKSCTARPGDCSVWCHAVHVVAVNCIATCVFLMFATDASLELVGSMAKFSRADGLQICAVLSATIA